MTPRTWQIALLALHPPLVLLYMLLARTERIAPSFMPVIALGLLPVASLLVGVWRWTRSRPPRPGRDVLLIAVALLEIAWTVALAAAVGFAIAWRSG